MNEKNGIIDALNGQMNEKNGIIDALNGQINEKNGIIDALNGQMNEKNGIIDALNGQIAEKNGIIDSLNDQMNEKNNIIDCLNGQIAEKNDVIDNLNVQVQSQGTEIAEAQSKFQQLLSTIETELGTEININEPAAEQAEQASEPATPQKHLHLRNSPPPRTHKTTPQTCSRAMEARNPVFSAKVVVG